MPEHSKSPTGSCITPSNHISVRYTKGVCIQGEITDSTQPVNPEIGNASKLSNDQTEVTSVEKSVNLVIMGELTTANSVVDGETNSLYSA